MIARERDLAIDISHQLRTRLTELRLQLEELAEHPDPLVGQEVQEALDQTDRLVTVVDDLLAIGVLVENSLLHGAGAVGVIVRPTVRGSGMVVLEVTDDGAGIPEGLVAHVFDRGVSTASSTGIGLGMERAFVEAGGGRLELRRASPPIFAIFLAVGRVTGPDPRTVDQPPVDQAQADLGSGAPAVHR